jgi:NAD-dependent deacetylase
MNRKRIVVLTGAGISAESGIRTFRDHDGLWENHRIEDVATPRAWKRDPALVLQFYNQRREQLLQVQPNDAHKGLALLEAQYDVSIITQNIDDLHERGGSTNVLHLHGELLKMRSEKDETLVYPISGDINLGDRAADGAQLRPHIVWFEEEVPLIPTAINIVSLADLFILVGTSLVVYPAAGLVDYLPHHVPKYIVDKVIPPVHRLKNVIPLEGTATEGVNKLLSLLL